MRAQKDARMIPVTDFIRLVVPPGYAGSFWQRNEVFADEASERESITWERIDNRIWIGTVTFRSLFEADWGSNVLTSEWASTSATLESDNFSVAVSEYHSDFSAKVDAAVSSTAWIVIEVPTD